MHGISGKCKADYQLCRNADLSGHPDRGSGGEAGRGTLRGGDRPVRVPEGRGSEPEPRQVRD